MKVVYVFIMPRSASYKLDKMILPQLEAGTHGVEVVGMFFSMIMFLCCATARRWPKKPSRPR